MRTEFSIVIPLSDHRQQTLAALDGWLAQDFPAARYELLFVAGPADADLIGPVAERLRAHDRLLTVDADFYSVQADAACRTAGRELLLLTEAHVIANPDCLARLAAWYGREGWKYDGASLKSYGINRSRLAELEQRLYDADYGSRMAPEHWNKVTVRGFTLPKSLYVASGGFDLRYGHFAELLWGYELFRQGRRFTTVADAVVGHFNNNDFAALGLDLFDFGQGMARFREEQPDHPLIRLLPRSLAWESVQAGRRLRAARDAAASGRRADWTFRDLLRMLRGPRWRRLQARIAQLVGRLRLSGSANDAETSLRHYAQIWNAVIDEGQADFLVRRPAAYPAPLRTYAAAERTFEPAVKTAVDSESFEAPGLRRRRAA